MEERLKPGDIVKHFKRELVRDISTNPMDCLYIIDSIGTHTETGEKLVVYRALYRNDTFGVDYNTYVRPYDIFMSEIDHEKYPDIQQRYRFERFTRNKTIMKG